jgi:hypothetical protein
MVSVQPPGGATLSGFTGMKSSPGIQANQNVPIVVVPVSLRVIVYW